MTKLRPLEWEVNPEYPECCWVTTHLGTFDIGKNSQSLYFIENDEYRYPVYFRTQQEAKMEVERMMLSWILDLLEAE